MDGVNNPCIGIHIVQRPNRHSIMPATVRVDLLPRIRPKKLIPSMAGMVPRPIAIINRPDSQAEFDVVEAHARVL
jgi:hypothetical protein